MRGKNLTFASVVDFFYMWLPPGFVTLRPKALGGIIGSCRAFGTALHRPATSSNPSSTTIFLPFFLGKGKKMSRRNLRRQMKPGFYPITFFYAFLA